MPDPSGQRDTPFAITLCSVGGTAIMQLDLSGEPEKASSDQNYGGENCPFGLSVAYKLMPGQDAPTLASVVSFHSAVPPARNQALPPLPALGPPLGSRAPPLGFNWPRA